MRKSLLRAIMMFCLLSVASVAKANPVDQRTAQVVAQNFLQQKTHERSDLALLDYANRADFTHFYVFGTDHSFVIVSADDCVRPILGYSADNGFGTGKMPEHVFAWFKGYDEGIATVVSYRGETTREIREEWSNLLNGNGLSPKYRNFVTPLIQTKWGQGYPFNILCPDGCLVGCVATAMAQVINYWEYPSRGIGSHKYYEPHYGWLYADFGKTAYDWDNMFDEFDIWGEYTDEELMAVSTLSYHCGIAVDMNYTQSISQAFVYANTMTQYFNYSPSARDVQKANYSDDEWCSLLVEELVNHQPILYTGYGATGHEFICDGFDENGYFHFNWGWEGDDDGYFQMGALNPYYSFNNDNMAILGLKPSECIAAEPSGLSYTLDGRKTTLEWIGSENAVSYNVYCNNILIGNTTLTTFCYESAPSGTNEFYVRSVDGEGRLSIGSNVVDIVITCNQLPVFYSFDDFATLPDCFTLETGNVHLSDGFGYEGSESCMEFDWMNFTHQDMCNLSVISVNDLDCSLMDNGLEVDFWTWKSGWGTNCSYQVQYSIDGSEWVNSRTVDCHGNDEWVPETFYFPELANVSNASIRFTYYCPVSQSGYIDNLEIKEAPSCFSPYSLTINANGDTSVSISWSAGIESESYIVAYGLKGIPIEEMTLLSVSDHCCVLNNLEPFTEYDIVIKAVCTDGEETDWSEVLSLQTEVSPSFPQYYSFDDGEMPNGVIIDGYYYVGGGCLIYGTPNGQFNSHEHPARFILPPLDLSEIEKGMEVNFKWLCQTNRIDIPDDRITTVIVQYSIDGVKWVDVGAPHYRYYHECVGVGQYELWMDVRVNVPKIGNEPKGYISIQVTEALVNAETYALDDVEVKEAEWFSPTEIKIENVTDNSAIISWHQNPDVANYVVAYGLKGSDVNTMTAVQTEDICVMLENLVSGAEYEVYVKACYNNGEEESGWSIPGTFKTASLSDLSNYITFDNGAIPANMVIEGPYQVSVSNEKHYGDNGYSLKFYSNDGWYSKGNRVVFPICTENIQSGVQLEFMWFHYRTIYDYWHMYIDCVQVQYSLDGSNWINVGGEIDRWSDTDTTYWTKETIQIEELTAQPFAYIGILFQGYYGYEGYIDNLILKEIHNIEEDTQMESLSIALNQTYHVKAPATLTVTGNLANNGDADNLVIEDGAQLIHNSENVKGLMQKCFIGHWWDDKFGWQFLSSPVIESLAPTAIENMVSLGYPEAFDIYRYSQRNNGKEWRNYRANSNSFSIDNGQGYLFSSPIEVSLSFKGIFQPSQNDFSVPLDYVSYSGLAGWNLIGNPFPCNAYVDRGYYVMNYDGSEIVPELSTMPVPPCTGLMVQAAGPNESATFSRNAPQSRGGQGSVKMELEQNGKVLDYAFLSYGNDALAQLSFREDHAKLFVKQDGMDYAIANMEQCGETTLCVKTVEDGTYVLRFNLNQLELKSLHLIDTFTGDDIDLLGISSYSFASSVEDCVERFKLVFEVEEF